MIYLYLMYAYIDGISLVGHT